MCKALDCTPGDLLEYEPDEITQNPRSSDIKS
ncbi:helix-turn-helix domain-containing protein [Paenibacillus elgii]|nr:helix-turn-helix domain-containing protein [Paenibacillus elgii]